MRAPVVAGVVLGFGLAASVVGVGPIAGQTPGGRVTTAPSLALDPSEPPPQALNEVRPQVFVDGSGRVYRLWVDEWAGEGRHIRFQTSGDGGRTWPTGALTLDRDSPEGGRSTAPAFVVDPASGQLHAAWRLKVANGKKHLQFSASSDHGQTWRPARTLNDEGAAFSGQLAAPGDGHVYAVWYDERRGRQGSSGLRSLRGLLIFFNHSTDGGQSWLPHDVPLSAADPSVGPRASEGAREPAAPEAEDARTPRSGESTTRGRGILSAQPRIQADAQGRVVVAWLDNREGRTEIYARASRDHGRSWGPEVNVSRGGNSARDHEILTDGAGRVFLVWTDNRDGVPDSFVARSEDGAATWAVPVRVSRGPRGRIVALGPSMALGPDGRLYVAWQDGRNGRGDIYLNVSADGGKTWLERDVRLDRDDAGTGISRPPHVVTGGPGEVAVVWEDDRAGFEQVLLTYSTDGGRSWLSTEVRVDLSTPPRVRARNPRAVWDRDGVLHVVWELWTGAGRDAEKRVEYRRLALRP